MARSLMLMVMINLAALCSGEDRVYKLLYQGGTIIDAPYVDYGTISKLRCAAICKLIPECWVYTWDSRTSQCRTPAPLTDLVTTTSAHTSLNTYFAYSLGGKSIHLTPSISTWNVGKTECEAMGGQLAIPRDVTHVMLLHHILQEKNYFIGIHRLPSATDLQEWLNEEGEVVPVLPLWNGGEPNNSGGEQYYLGISYGHMFDLADHQTRKAICEI